ncbi:MAG: helix-turn-helix domain-containing protein [Oscillospiraceae bacterium]|jgi:transcriptional regulator with XRE-family HTH domain|nr:helix-turn-helix domain-containing protein [Oscillospiraceae bacterium]
MVNNYIDLLRRLRKANGLTQQQVAEYLHLDRSTYAYYESGRTKISIDMLLRLAELFRVSISSLVGEIAGVVQLRDPAEEYSGTISVLINDSVSRFSHLSREEQRLVILYRSGSEEERAELLEAAEHITAPGDGETLA